MAAAEGAGQGIDRRFHTDGSAAVLLAVADNPRLAVRCTFTSLLGRHVEDSALNIWFMPEGCLALNAKTLPLSRFTVQALCRRHSDSQTPVEPPTLLADLTAEHAWSKWSGRVPILPEGYGRPELRDFARTELGIVVCQDVIIPPIDGRLE